MTSILGQFRSLEILSTALRSGRFHHGWIFSGPRGVGKFTTALQIARVLLDPEVNAESLDLAAPIQNPKSKIQNQIDSNTHPDLHIITKELAKFSDNAALRERKLMNIPLDLLRERVLGGRTADDRIHEAPAYRTAALGHGKVFIIDEAELLDPNAQNAMLKTLEEPPPQTYFFLVTSLPDRLLSTIRSRCQHVRFNRLDPPAMRQWLKTHNVDGSFAGQSAAPGAIAWIEQFADGAPGMAKLAAEFGFFEWQQTLGPMIAELDRGRYPTGMGAALGERIEAFAVAWVKKHGEKNTSKDAANKDGARHMLALLAANLRQGLVADLDRGADLSPRLAAIDLLNDAEQQLQSNVNMKLLMENLVVQWAEAHAVTVERRV